MAGWSGGSVSFSWNGSSYSVNYSAPSYTFPPDTNSQTGPFVSSAGPSTVAPYGSASQTYTVTYKENGLSATITSSTTISGTAPAAPAPTYPPAWSDNTLAGFQADVAYSDGVTATNMGYSGSYSVVSGALPTGVSLNSGSGAVTGTPTTAGQSYSFTLRASNSYGSVDAAFSGTVAASPTAGKLKTWNGTAWVYGPVKVWDGSVWVSGTVKVWDGTVWGTSV